MIGIYKITNPIGQVYIGQSIDIEKRFYTYKKSLGKGQPNLNQSFLKYGINGHIFEIITLCDRGDLNKIELYYIRLFDANNYLNCINSKPTGIRISKAENALKFKLYLKKQLEKKEIKVPLKAVKDQPIVALHVYKYGEAQKKKQELAKRKEEKERKKLIKWKENNPYYAAKL